MEVASPFDGVEGVLCSSTPSGEVASTTHVGPYSALGGAHDAILGWCDEHHLTRAGVFWEVYGDWHEDPAHLRTDVFYLLRSDGT